MTNFTRIRAFGGFFFSRGYAEELAMMMATEIERLYVGWLPMETVMFAWDQVRFSLPFSIVCFKDTPSHTYIK